MSARLRVRRSRFAGWSRWLGVFSLPVLVVSALGRHFGLIDPPAALGAIGLGSLMGLAAAVFAIAALVGIWRDGRLGLGDAIRGLVPGTIAMLPLFFAGWAAMTHPRLNDITTDIVDPPLFLIDTRTGLFAANRIDPPSLVEREFQRRAYADIVSRRFPLSPALLYEAARQTVADLGWTIVAESAPAAEAPIGVIQAVAETELFAFPDDVVIRIVPDDYGARMDVRSASRYGAHDLGTNAERIRTLLMATDDMLVQTLGQTGAEDSPDADRGVDAEGEDQPPAGE